MKSGSGFPFARSGVWAAALGLTLAALAYFETSRKQENADRRSGLASAVWNNIGGCGSSGGGAAAGAGKWMGRGVSGGLVDLEVLSNHTLGGDYTYHSQSLSSTLHFPSQPRFTMGLGIAFKSNTFEYEGYKVSEDLTSRMVRQTGGLGDLSMNANWLFGETLEQSLGLSVSLPTGQHDIKRLHFKGQNIEPDDVRWMNPYVQPGSGLHYLGLSYEYTKTKDWGLMVAGASYTSAWAADNWGCRDELSGTVNDKMLSCQEAGPSAMTWKLWELQHQPFSGDPQSWNESYGAPGTGATGADAISLYGYVGHKEESSTQSLGLTLNMPLSPTYYWESGPGSSNNRVSTRIRSNDYSLKISAGLEITHPYFPVFLSLGIPYRLTDIVNRGRLVSPTNYIGSMGVKGTFL